MVTSIYWLYSCTYTFMISIKDKYPDYPITDNYSSVQGEILATKAIIVATRITAL